MGRPPSPARRATAVVLAIVLVLWPIVGSVGAVEAATGSGIEGSGAETAPAVQQSSDSTGSGAFVGGNGTRNDPYRIRTVAQLQRIDEFPDAHFVLIDDVDASGAEFDPIGTAERPFTGSLDGNGHTITSLTVRGSSRVGLFAVTDGSIISNVSLVDASAVLATPASTSVNKTALLAAEGSNDTVRNVRISGEMTAAGEAGFVFAEGTGFELENISVDGTLRAANAGSDVQAVSNVGGVLGSTGGPYRSPSAAPNLTARGLTVDLRLGSLEADSVGGVVGSSLNGNHTVADVRVDLSGDSLVAENVAGVVAGSLRDGSGRGVAVRINVTEIVIEEDFFAGSVGGVVAENLEGRAVLSNVRVGFDSREIRGPGHFGGAVGVSTFDNSTVAGVSAKVNVSSLNVSESAGGVIGSYVDDRSSVSDVEVTFDVKKISSNDRLVTVGGAVGAWVAGESEFRNASIDFSANSILAVESVGGAVGGWVANEASASDIDVTFTAGSITADESAAGAIGGWVPNQASASDIDVTFTADNITAGESVAGAVGGWLAQDGTLSEVETEFNAGNITAGESVGGMVGGWLAQTSTVRASDLTFSARTVEADASVGGLVGGWVANNASVHNTTLSADIEHARGGNAVSGIVGGDLSGNGENTRVRLANVTADFHATRATTEASDDAAVSGIAWEAFLTELDTVSVRMTVDETETVYATGGVGAAYSTKADRLDLQVDMAGTAEQAGGAIGVVESPEADIRRTSVSGSLVFPDTSSAGGFVGRVNADGAVIDRSRADVDVTGGDSVGGFVGNTTANGSFDNTAATGSVTGSGSVGGYAGALLDGVVRRSFATGAVDSGPSGSTGGVAGETADAAAVTETYWDTEATGVDESPVGSGLTTAEMTGPAARGNVSGFDFEFTWTVTSPTAYPRLRALDGRKQDGPANVTDWYDLDAVRENPDGEYVLTADLNRSTPGYGEVAGPNANSGQGFEPIGNATQPFTGTVDGDGHTIFGLRIDRPDQNQIGVFGQNTGTIRNVSLGDVEVLGATSTGALVGSNEGLVARASSAGSTATDDEANAVGGLVGQNRGTIEASRSSGTVTGARQVDSQDPFQGQYGQFWTGGLVGYNEGIVSNSTSSADVTGSIAVGGLVGQQEAGPGTPTIENSSAHGRVSAPGFTTGTGVGGLVGRTYGEVRDSFATGAVSGSGYFLQEVGGLAGSNTGTIRDSYWDRENSGRSDSAGGTPLTTAEMTGAAARENMSGFDFENTWVVPGPGEYPRIRALLVDDGETSATEITDWYELDAVRENRSRNYTLTNDLDETTAGYEEVAGPTANNGTGFEPIGNDSDPFTGTFDGAGHTISGLTIDRTGENTVGLFGASDGTVSNVTLSGASVTGGGPVGALVGENTGTVAGVSAQVEIDGSGRFAARIGGLVGENRGGSSPTPRPAAP